MIVAMRRHARPAALAVLLVLAQAAHGQDPLLQLQGEPYSEGSLGLHLSGPVGQPAIVLYGLDPLVVPVQTGKGPFHIGTLFNSIALGAVPPTGRIDAQFQVPAISPALAGIPIILQGFVQGQLSNPATLPLDQPHHVSALAVGLASPNPLPGANFGDRVAVGDLNADGVKDLAVGAWFEDVAGMDKAGRVYVLWGPSFAAHVVLNPAVPVNFGTFGASVTVADFTGDGLDDLLVAETPSDPPGPSEVGRLHVFEGGPTFSAVPVLTVTSPRAGDAYSNYGRSLVVGDFDGDAAPDIAVGNMKETVQGFAEAGRIDVFWGPTFAATTTIDHPTPKASDFFGSALAVGDVNGDGIDDLIEGSGRADVGSVVNQGRVHVFAGPTLALTATLDNPFPQGFNSRFGEQVCAADLDGDGMAEVIVCDLKNRVYLFRAPDLATFTEFRKPFALNTVNINAVSFGYYLAAGDMNDDGVTDVLVSDVFEGTLAGCPGGREGILFVALGPYYSTFQVLRPNLPACGDGFSWALLVEDLDGDGRLDIISNSPTADVGGIQNSGATAILLGTPGP